MQVFVHPELLNKDGTLDAEVARNHPELEVALQKQRAAAEANNNSEQNKM